MANTFQPVITPQTIAITIVLSIVAPKWCPEFDRPPNQCNPAPSDVEEQAEFNSDAGDDQAR